MKRIMIIGMLTYAIAIHGMQMPPRPSVITTQPEKSYLEQLPGDLKKIIVANIITNDIDATINNLKSLDATSTVFHDFINRQDTMKVILTRILNQTDGHMGPLAIKKLSKTNKQFHDFINRPQTLQAIITTLADRTRGVDAIYMATRLASMPGMQNPIMAQWVQQLEREKDFTDELEDAAGSNNFIEIRNLLRKGAPINGTNTLGNTALHIAADYNRKEAVQELIQQGADVNKPNKWGRTPLKGAVAYNHPDTVALLINAGADVNYQDAEGWNALIKAAYDGHRALVKQLIEARAKLNLQNNKGATALMLAIELGNNDIACDLINAGADVTIQNNKGETALDYAQYMENNDLIKLMSQKIQEQKKGRP